jgi:hypothetical protein
MDADEDMISRIKAAIDHETAGIYYRGKIPEPRTRSIWSPPPWVAVPVAASAVAVAAIVGPLLVSITGDGDVSGGLRAGAAQVVSNPVMLANALDQAAQSGQPQTRDCLPSPSPRCAVAAEDPYPLVVETDATVPAGARPYAALTGWEGEVVKGWVGQDNRGGRGASVWLKYPTHVAEVSTQSFSTGKQLADFLAAHPS